MAMKPFLLLLACLLSVTMTVSSLEEAVVTEHTHKAPPPHAPTKPVVHPPVKAPAPSPIIFAPPFPQAPPHAPTKPVVHPPVKAPAPSPIIFAPPFAHYPGCSGKCVKYCDGKPKKRWCQRVCTACCSKCKCVPGKEFCGSWNKVVYHGELVSCP